AQYRFEALSGGGYKDPPSLNATLTDNTPSGGTADIAFHRTGVKLKFAATASPANGHLASVVDQNGNTISYQYDSSGRHQTIHDTQDRNTNVTTQTTGKVEKLTDLVGTG